MTIAGFDLTGRVAIVTGGGTGIGKAVALLLARRGATVVVAGRRPEPLAQTVTQIGAQIGGQTGEASGTPCLAVPSNVCDPADAKALVDRTLAEYGRLDILINNAGKASHASYSAMATEVWDRDVSLNLSAAFYCSKAALSALRAGGNGAIVNVSSVAGINGTMGVGAYSAAKAGLQMFTRVAAAEWGPRGVRVNCVAPGMIGTDLARAGWKKSGFDAMAACQAFPLRRPGEPDEVAQAIVFLASDAASYITGETLTVGGGPAIKGFIDQDDLPEE